MKDLLSEAFFHVLELYLIKLGFNKYIVALMIQLIKPYVEKAIVIVSKKVYNVVQVKRTHKRLMMFT